jgi:TatD DNase family protein
MFYGRYSGRDVHPPDVDAVLNRAAAAGVMRTIVTAGTLEQANEALELARTRSDLFCTVGVHPTRSRAALSQLDLHIAKLAEVIERGQQKVVAVGELGLDYDRLQFSDAPEQRPVFEAQFALAEKTGLPLFLHDRNTNGDFAEIIRENRSRFTTGVVHSFTGTVEEMRGYIAQGLYIGLNGCSLKTEQNIAVAKEVPLDRLMLETDCPYW